MSTYTACVTGREGRWWAITIPELGADAVTQAKRLEDVADEARDYISVTLDAAPSAITVDVVVDDLAPAHNVTARAREIREQRELIAALQERVQAESAALAVELDKAGVPVRDIATLVGISFQRVGQIITEAHQSDVRRSA